MRDILNLLDNIILTEGRGLAARVPGEQFKNAQGDVITFQSLNFYPERGKFGTPEEMQAAIDQLGLNIHWTNKPNVGTLGFGIAIFTDVNNNPYYLGRYYKEISANRINNDWQHDAIPGGFKYQSKAGQKENTGYKPSEVLTQLKTTHQTQLHNRLLLNLVPTVTKQRH